MKNYETVFLPERIEDLNVLIFGSHTFSELQQWGGALTIYLSSEFALSFCRDVVFSIITIILLEDTTRKPSKEGIKLTSSVYRAVLSSRAAEPGSQIQSCNDQMITGIQSMNSRKFKQIPFACSYQDLYK